MFGGVEVRLHAVTQIVLLGWEETDHEAVYNVWF
jgi:hypothetical protein